MLRRPLTLSRSCQLLVVSQGELLIFMQTHLRPLAKIWSRREEVCILGRMFVRLTRPLSNLWTWRVEGAGSFSLPLTQPRVTFLVFLRGITLHPTLMEVLVLVLIMQLHPHRANLWTRRVEVDSSGRV